MPITIINILAKKKGNGNTKNEIEHITGGKLCNINY